MDRIIIDVREPFEYQMDHVKGAINIPLSKLLNGLDSNILDATPSDSEIILYCNSGSRSGVAVNIFKNMGYTKAINGIDKNSVISRYSVE